MTAATPKINLTAAEAGK